MSRNDGRSYSSISIVIFFFVCALFTLILEGCATTPATTGPGIPDAMQLQHYEMVETAIEAMQLGAFDYITKPFNDEELRQLCFDLGIEQENLPGDTRIAKSQALVA